GVLSAVRIHAARVSPDRIRLAASSHVSGIDRRKIAAPLRGASAPHLHRRIRVSYNRRMETHLDKRFGFLISDVDRLCGKRFDDLAKSSLDLTRAQCRALAYLSHYGEMNH